ncbi:tigger transposable element-derived protein 4-like [Aphis craccivora]|uniref:Tigger transposable element-derived protein 4-like n=1 Tax=Aphis craccivora TaxID=307492 RepID=A0A6G0VTH6_APHCR|nr:tigger transposable element-derived protein 4-like [Aphis craccivora]
MLPILNDYDLDQLIVQLFDMDFSEFRKISHFCWNHSDYGFMVIDKTRKMNEVYTYSCNIDKIYMLKETDILNSLFSMNKDKVLLKNLVLSKKYIKRKIMNMKRGVKDSDNYFLQGDSENESNSSFDNFLISNPKLQRYDKSYSMHYDSIFLSLLIMFIYRQSGNLKPQVKTPQFKLKEFDNFLSSSSFEEPPTDQLFKFSLSSSVKKGSGLYKDCIMMIQIVVRLNLLTSSRNAGNTGVNNEIISIIEELHERNIIV